MYTFFYDETVLEVLDIIILDDGFQDATADIAEKFRQMYPNRIRLIFHGNTVHGGAMNFGFSATRRKHLAP